MSIVTFEGIVEEGHIHLKNNVHLPDKTKVYVVVPDFDGPRLMWSEQE